VVIVLVVISVLLAALSFAWHRLAAHRPTLSLHHLSSSSGGAFSDEEQQLLTDCITSSAAAADDETVEVAERRSQAIRPNLTG